MSLLSAYPFKATATECSIQIQCHLSGLDKYPDLPYALSQASPPCTYISGYLKWCYMPIFNQLKPTIRTKCIKKIVNICDW